MNLRRLFFNLWYLRRPPWDSGVSPPELMYFMEEHPPQRAVDLGCGTGTNVLTLARSGWDATGIDYAPRAIQIAKRKAAKANVSARFFVGDVTRYKFDSQFDFALDIGCFHGLDKRADYLTQLTRILAPNGFWLMYGFFVPAPLRAGPGLAEADLDLISSFGLTLLSRKDGVDRRNRPSAWFLFRNGLRSG